MNVKRRILIFLNIFYQIQQDNQDAINGIEKSIATICKEEGISFEQLFYILYLLFFIVVFVLSFQSREFILGQPITFKILYLQLYVMIGIVVQQCGQIAYKCTLGLKREKTCKFFLRFPQKFSSYTHFELSKMLSFLFEPYVKGLNLVPLLVKKLLLYFYSALGFNKTFLNLQLQGVTRRMKTKQTPEAIKKELLASILEVFE